MPKQFKHSLVIVDGLGNQLINQDGDNACESSSTIKIPIVTFSLNQMAGRGQSLSTKLERLPKHASKGAGILNWMDIKTISLEQLIFTTLTYSDCLATNMLIDYIGGKDAINEWFRTSGYVTQLKMPYLDFTDEEELLPQVGETTPSEMTKLYMNIENNEWPADVAALINQATANVHESWLKNAMTGIPDNFHHKTGSMIQSSAKSETVLNAVGSFTKKSAKFYFGLFSLNITNNEQDIIMLKKHLADSLSTQISML